LVQKYVSTNTNTKLFNDPVKADAGVVPFWTITNNSVTT
jgi:hypothetical protein